MVRNGLLIELHLHSVSTVKTKLGANDSQRPVLQGAYWGVCLCLCPCVPTKALSAKIFICMPAQTEPAGRCDAQACQDR